ncbi:hypothetical protein [Synechococcus sp. PCC 7336]|uniref:hypothetical protein n=1 Tax=Synechococcus sp. PCC 7336 TaxID=195250 RepID=UPI00034BEC1C|nr:hypothetical protein [Synechococcus sp. PCC 7336]
MANQLWFFDAADRVWRSAASSVKGPLASGRAELIEGNAKSSPHPRDRAISTPQIQSLPTH